MRGFFVYVGVRCPPERAGDRLEWRVVCRWRQVVVRWRGLEESECIGSRAAGQRQTLFAPVGEQLSDCEPPTVAEDRLVPDSRNLLAAEEAARTLGISRRTLDRLMASGELERVRGSDGRSYVSRQSVAVVARARQEGERRRLRAPDADTLLEAITRLVEGLREERSALLEAMREREEARVELAAAQAELEALRTGCQCGESPRLRTVSA